MSSLFRDLNSAAIDGKLNKNEFLLFNALMSQTLGFGKCSDPLTDKRLASLTGIRLDRLRPALNGFLKRDIFQRQPHDKYQYEYCIADRFFDDVANKKVYTPHYAKSGEVNEKPANLTTNGGEQPAKRGHTVTNLTEIQKKPPQPPTEKTFTKKTPPQKTNTDFKKSPPPKKISETPFHQEEAVVEIFMAGLSHMPEQFVVQSSQAVRIKFSSQDIGNVAVVQKTETAAETVTAIATPVDETIHTTIPIATEADANTVDNDSDNDVTESHVIVQDEPIVKPNATLATDSVSMAESLLTKPLETTEITEKPVVVVDLKEGEKKPLKLPKAVGEVNINTCNRRFKPLSYQHL